ncbi:MAG: hypothetical protein ACYC61_25140, partial [Isosphaeraceae bacterium]
PRDRMAKERRKKGARWRTYKIPPWRRPGGRTIYKHYPGYPAPPQPVRRRRKMSAERKRRMARNFIKLFQSLGLWTVLIALFLPAEGSPGLASGQRPMTAADATSFHHEGHEGHGSHRSSHSCPSCDSWSILPIAAGSVVRGGPTAPTRAVFRVLAASTPAKTQNEANFGGISGFAATAKPASTHPRDRSRGPPRSQIAAITAARPPPMARFMVPH